MTASWRILVEALHTQDDHGVVRVEVSHDELWVEHLTSEHHAVKTRIPLGGVIALLQREGYEIEKLQPPTDADICPGCKDLVHDCWKYGCRCPTCDDYPEKRR
jgi:hypothetical protein